MGTNKFSRNQLNYSNNFDSASFPCDSRYQIRMYSYLTRFVLSAVLSLGALSAGGGVGLVPTLVEPESALDMVQEGEGAGGEGVQLIAPRRLPNPCVDSPQRMDLHRELLFNQRM